MGSAMRYQPQGRVQLDRANPLTKGLTHSWGTNIRGASALYDATGRADGRFGAGLGGTSGNSWRLGPSGYFVSFDDSGTGTVDSVALAVGDAAGSGSPGANAFSFVARIRLGSLTSTSQALYGSDASGGIEIRITSTGAIELLKQAVAGIGASTGTLSAGVDVDVAVTYDGTVVQFYINGSPAGSANNPQTFIVATQCYLGFANVGSGGTRERLSNGSRLYKADIWNRAISRSEVAAWSQNPWQLFSAGSNSSAYQASIASASNGAAPVAASLSGAAQAAASGAGALSTSISLTGTAAAVASAFGSVSTAIPLAGVASATSSGVGTLSTAVRLVGTAPVTASSTGTLSTLIRLAGTASASAAAAGTLAGSGASLAGAAQSTASGAGSLTTSIALSGATNVRASAQGQLTTKITLSGAATAIASGQAALIGSGIPAVSIRAVDISPSHTVVFEGGKHAVIFEGGRHAVTFAGCGTRDVSRTVRF